MKLDRSFRGTPCFFCGGFNSFDNCFAPFDGKTLCRHFSAQKIKGCPDIGILFQSHCNGFSNTACFRRN